MQHLGALGFAAVGLGAALGAWLRWLLGLLLNSTQATLPWGTLAANWLGALAIGVAVVCLQPTAAMQGITQDAYAHWRLFLITGLLGGLTTFSTFSLEAYTLLQHGKWPLALAHTALHLLGSLLFVALGAAAAHAYAR